MRIEAIKIEEDHVTHLSGLDSDDVVELVRGDCFAWIDIYIVSDKDPALGQLLVERLDFHPATVSDCFQPSSYHQPKMDEEQDYRFITFIYYEMRTSHKLTNREFHIYHGKSYVITLHRHTCEDILTKIRQFPQRITDYEQLSVLFLHHVLDMITDTFSEAVRELNQSCGELEIAVLNVKRPQRVRNLFRRPKDQLADMRRILRLRRTLIWLKRTLQAEEEIVEQFVDRYDYAGAPEASEEIAIYFRDISDHIGKYLEMLEAMESTMNHLMEVYTLITNHRTNEIIYVLTIISTIMLPLNIVVGFWGMNFKYLWLSNHPQGLLFVSGGMGALIVVLLLFFRYKEWI